MTKRSLFLLGIYCTLCVLLIPAAIAYADVPVRSTPTLVVPQAQLWTLMIGAFVPLVTYVINHVGPWVSEPIKGFVLAVAAIIASALYTALDTNVFGFNAATLQLVAASVLMAFLTHALVWKPSGVSTALGGGSNRKVVAAP
jgi:hypothetical protein